MQPCSLDLLSLTRMLPLSSAGTLHPSEHLQEGCWSQVRVDAEDRTVSKIKRGHLLERKLTIDKDPL